VDQAQVDSLAQGIRGRQIRLAFQPGGLRAWRGFASDCLGDMITEENDLRFRNARMRAKIMDLLACADGPTGLRVRSIVEKQGASETDNAVESLKRVHENLRMRAAELVRAGFATPEDFQGL
jgi:hypothetical protein